MTSRHFDIEPASGLPTEYGLLAAALQDGTREWREELGDVPDEAMYWQPFENGHSIGALILHMVDVEAFWIETVALERERSQEELKELLSDEVDQYAFNWIVPPKKPLAYYYEIQDRIRDRTLQSIRHLPEPSTVIEREGWSYSTTIRWILNHVVAHESYHGGQAVLLKALWERKSA